jgi:hypothetical protein
MAGGAGDEKFGHAVSFLAMAGLSARRLLLVSKRD